MAVALLTASSEALSLATAPVTAAPMSLSCWFNLTDAAGIDSLFGVGDLSETDNFIALAGRGDLAGDPLELLVQDSAGLGGADTTTGFTAGTWHHGAGVLVSATDRSAYIDGGSKGTDTSDHTPTGIDNTKIGRIPRASSFFYADGSIAEAAIWNVALTDAEVLILSKGFSPLLVRPASLVFYAPCIRDVSAGNWRDYIGGIALTEIGTPTVAVHDFPLFQPAPLQIIPAPAAAVENPDARGFIPRAMVY